jgi:hypothetical protein
MRLPSFPVGQARLKAFQPPTLQSPKETVAHALE